MKWSNHSKLDVYGVHIVGWPDSVPQKNPSTLSLAQNKLILDLLNNGELRFVRIEGAPAPESGIDVDAAPQKDEDAIFADSIDYAWVSSGDAGAAASTSMVRSLGSLLWSREGLLR